MYNDQKNSDPSGSLFFDKYQVISEMQENKRLPKITTLKICITVLMEWATVVCDKTLVHQDNEVIIYTAIPLFFGKQVHISSLDFLQ